MGLAMIFPGFSSGNGRSALLDRQDTAFMMPVKGDPAPMESPALKSAELFREDAYLKSCDAVVTAVDEKGIRLDRTVFYPTGGGQPGDVGRLRATDGTVVEIRDTIKGATPGEIVHVPAAGAPVLAPGTAVTAELDWDRRHRLMRMHTCLHLLSSNVTGEVTGGQDSEGKER